MVVLIRVLKAPFILFLVAGTLAPFVREQGNGKRNTLRSTGTSVTKGKKASKEVRKVVAL